MKALIRKYPDTPTKKTEDEVLLEPNWLDWFGPNGEPLTDENYGYALCENVPDDATDVEPSDFTVVQNTKQVPSETGDGAETTTVKYWTAIYKGGN